MVLQCVHTHQVKCFISKSGKVDEKFWARDTHGTTGRFASDCKPPFAPGISWKLPNTEWSFRVTHHNTVGGVVNRCTRLSDVHFPFRYQNTETCNITTTDFCASLVAQSIKDSPAVQETGFDPRFGKISWTGEQLPTPVFLPGESHGQRSLAGCSPWGRRESDTTELLSRQVHPVRSKSTLF